MVVEGDYRPHINETACDTGLPQAGNDQTGSAATPFDAFVKSLAGGTTDSEERGVQIADPTIPFFYMDRINKRFDGIGNDVEDELDGLTFKPTEEQNQMLLHVKLAYGIIAHPFCEVRLASGETSPVYQLAIEEEIAMDKDYEGHTSVVLTDQERALLVQIATVTGIPCDPERSEYNYDEIQPTQ